MYVSLQHWFSYKVSLMTIFYFQIAERKKLVSSIRNSVINSDDAPADKAYNSQNDALGANQTLVKNEYDISTGAARQSDSASSKVNVDQLQVPLSLLKEKSGQTKSALEMSNLDSSQPKEVLTKATETDSSISNGSPIVGKREMKTIGSLPREASANGVDTSSTNKSSSIKDREEKKLGESYFKELSELVNDAAVEDDKPPPLAGQNVMNVILVAAECAPWCKTGLYFP